jgi:virginiamycin B lyase
VKAPDGHAIGSYGIYADAQNNLYGLDFSGSPFSAERGEYIMRIDGKSGAMTTYHTPTWVSKPRRGRFDSQGRLWFAEYQGNNIGMLDPQTGQIKEWPLPDRFFFPYDAVSDRTGEIWTGSMWTDRVVRLDPKTGTSVSYLLPRSTNIRRVFVQNGTNPPTLWVGSNHGGSIVRLQPME